MGLFSKKVVSVYCQNDGKNLTLGSIRLFKEGSYCENSNCIEDYKIKNNLATSLAGIILNHKETKKAIRKKELINYGPK